MPLVGADCDAGEGTHTYLEYVDHPQPRYPPTYPPTSPNSSINTAPTAPYKSTPLSSSNLHHKSSSIAYHRLKTSLYRLP